ncbi:MAG: hypothetical protein M3389_14900 [Actinomycetota bacterium]|nr:hypothetical protein [Actinomycetota bacterium]
MTQLLLPFDTGEPGNGPAFPDDRRGREHLQVCERTVRRAIDAGVLRAARVRGTTPAEGDEERP